MDEGGPGSAGANRLPRPNRMLHHSNLVGVRAVEAGRRRSRHATRMSPVFCRPCWPSRGPGSSWRRSGGRADPRRTPTNPGLRHW